MATGIRPEWVATGERLRAIELAEGKSGLQVADELGITATTWSKYKMGKRELPIWLAGELRRLYGVSLEWLFLDEFHRNSDDFKQRFGAAQRAAVKRPRGRPRRPPGSGST